MRRGQTIKSESDVTVTSLTNNTLTLNNIQSSHRTLNILKYLFTLRVSTGHFAFRPLRNHFLKTTEDGNSSLVQTTLISYIV